MVCPLEDLREEVLGNVGTPPIRGGHRTVGQGRLIAPVGMPSSRCHHTLTSAGDVADVSDAPPRTLVEVRRARLKTDTINFVLIRTSPEAVCLPFIILGTTLNTALGTMNVNMR